MSGCSSAIILVLNQVYSLVLCNYFFATFTRISRAYKIVEVEMQQEEKKSRECKSSLRLYNYNKISACIEWFMHTVQIRMASVN